MRRSTRFRRRYISLLNGPCRFMFWRLGIVTRIPRFLKKVTTGWPQYPLSPTNRFGLLRGRPRPGRLTAPFSSKAGTCFDSASWPGVNTRQIGLPPPSARRCTLVLNPPRLRPNASAAGVVFLPRPHVDEPELSSHPQNGLPNQFHHLCHRPSVMRPAPDPRYRLCATDKTGWKPCASFHIGWVDRARALLCAESTGCH